MQASHSDNWSHSWFKILTSHTLILFLLPCPSPLLWNDDGGSVTNADSISIYSSLQGQYCRRGKYYKWTWKDHQRNGDKTKPVPQRCRRVRFFLKMCSLPQKTIGSSIIRNAVGANTLQSPVSAVMYVGCTNFSACKHFQNPVSFADQLVGTVAAY